MLTEKLRVTCSTESIASDETLQEFTNILQGPIASTLDGELVLLFDDVNQANKWAQLFNITVYPNEMGFMIGREYDSLIQKYP